MKRKITTRVLLVALVAVLLGLISIDSTAQYFPSVQQAKLVAAGEASFENAGQSVSISADGNTALVGSPFPGSDGYVWVWTRTGSTWTVQQKLEVTDETGVDGFGKSVSLSADGSTAVIGGPADNTNIGAVWVFTRSGSTWTEQTKIVADDETGSLQFGYSVSVNSDGTEILVGSFDNGTGAGGVWALVGSGSTWAQQRLQPTGGTVNDVYPPVAISSDGTTAIAGRNVFAYNTTTKKFTSQPGIPLPSNITGASFLFASPSSGIAISSDGNTAVIPNFYDNNEVGACFVYVRNGTTWSEQQKLVGTNYNINNGQVFQGASIAITADGNTIVEGGWSDNNQEGAMWAFTRSGSVWTQRGTKKVGTGVIQNGGGPLALTSAQGISIAISSDGSTSIVGGYGDANYTGAAWVFVNSTTSLPVPTITSFTPTSASYTNVVTISGSNFENIATVSFGGTPALSFQIVDDNTITAEVGNGTSGRVSVSDGANSASLNGFTYEVPPVPGTPTNVTATDGNGGFVVNFTPPANPYNVPVTFNYTVSNGTGVVASGSGPTTSFTINGLQNDVTYTFSVTASNISGTGPAGSTTVTPCFCWIGGDAGSETTWDDANNWLGNVVPTATDNITIPLKLNGVSISYLPHIIGGIGTNKTVNNVNFYQGLSTDVGTGTFTATGDVIFHPNPNGTIIGLDGNIVFQASGNNTVTGIAVVQNLTIDGSGGGTTTISSASGTTGLQITGVLNVINNCTLNTGDNLIFRAFETGINTYTTGVIGQVQPGNIINGNVQVQRPIPQGNRAFVDLCPGVANAGTFYNNWQEGGNKTTGLGVDITGGTTVNGFDQTPLNNPSMYSCDDQNWVPIPGTNGLNTMDVFRGYRVLVRGDRTINLQNPTCPCVPLPPPNQADLVPLYMKDATLIRAKGQLVTGGVEYISDQYNPADASDNGLRSSYGLTPATVDANGFSLVANPYWCPINWNSIVGNTELTGLSNTYLYFDPTVTYTDPTTGLPDGTYVSYNSITGSNNTQSKVNNIIQPGEAFWVQNDGTMNVPQMLISESDKFPTAAQTAIFGTPKVLNRLSITLWRDLAVQGIRNIDGAVAVFDNNFSKGFGKEDSKKAMNGGGNIFIEDAGTNLSIDGLPMPTVNDNITIALSNITANSNYQLKIFTNELSTPSVSAYLADKYLGTIQLLGADSTIISFTPTSDTSTYSNRFSIVFKPNALPVKFTAVNATNSGNNVLVSWSTADEANAASYMVEKSTDGKTFVDATTQIAKNTAAASYSWLDENAVSGSNYYRIKVVGKDGSSIYSNVVSVQFAIHNSKLSIFPNPVTANSFNLLLEGVATGMYNLRLTNTLGQAVMNKTLLITSVSSVHQIDLVNKVSAGTYILKVEGNNGSYQAQVIIK